MPQRYILSIKSLYVFSRTSNISFLVMFVILFICEFWVLYETYLITTLCQDFNFANISLCFLTSAFGFISFTFISNSINSFLLIATLSSFFLCNHIVKVLPDEYHRHRVEFAIAQQGLSQGVVHTFALAEHQFVVSCQGGASIGHFEVLFIGG